MNASGLLAHLLTLHSRTLAREDWGVLPLVETDGIAAVAHLTGLTQDGSVVSASV